MYVMSRKAYKIYTRENFGNNLKDLVQNSLKTRIKWNETNLLRAGVCLYNNAMRLNWKTDIRSAVIECGEITYRSFCPGKRRHVCTRKENNILISLGLELVSYIVWYTYCSRIIITWRIKIRAFTRADT